MPRSTTASPQSANERATQVARAFARVGQAQDNTASVRSALRGVSGITANVTDHGHEHEITASLDTPIPGGLTREELTASKLAELDSKHLAAFNEQVWQVIKSRAISGSLTAEQATELLDELGYTARPEEETDCRFDVIVGTTWNNHGERLDMVEHVSYIAPGVTSEESLRALAAEMFPGAGGWRAEIRARVEGARNMKAGIRNVTAKVMQTWPDHSEHYVSE